MTVIWNHAADIVLLTIFLFSASAAQEEEEEKHEWAEIEFVDLTTIKDYILFKTSMIEKNLGGLSDFRLPDTAGSYISFYEFLRDEEGNKKKIVMLTFLKSSCKDSKYQAPALVKAFNRFNSAGFDILAVFEYSQKIEVEDFMWTYGIPFKVVMGTTNSDDEDIRFINYHYRLRRSLGDDRKWGTPLHFFIVNGDLKRVWYARGELKLEQIARFIESKL